MNGTETVEAGVARDSGRPGFLEFFAGSGLVAKGLESHFKAVWANDICAKKASVYTANHGSNEFHLGSIADVAGESLPKAALSWASFPCQDLSLAGLTAGIHAERSGLVWEWLRIMDEMPVRPKVLVAENVTGLVSAGGGLHYRALHKALASRGYTVGAVMLDAAHWVPQSRQRVFVIAVESDRLVQSHLLDTGPNWAHPLTLVNAAKGLDDWVWWKLPVPAPRKTSLSDVVEWNAPCDQEPEAERKIRLVSPAHRERLGRADAAAIPGYTRTRKNGPVLELRFDGVAGCLRTAEGGSSRQVLLIKRDNKIHSRLLTVREAARLMGAPDSYRIPGSYNDGYTAMGDAVAVPVAEYLGKHLLSPLVKGWDD